MYYMYAYIYIYIYIYIHLEQTDPGISYPLFQSPLFHSVTVIISVIPGLCLLLPRSWPISERRDACDAAK